MGSFLFLFLFDDRLYLQMKIILVFTVYLINHSITMIIEVHLLEVVHCEKGNGVAHKWSLLKPPQKNAVFHLATCCLFLWPHHVRLAGICLFA